MYEILWYFLIYAFLGWCGEVCFAALKTRGFVNRGFLNGPVCPIYGVGMVVVVLMLEPVQDRLAVLFLCSILLTSALEWLTGFVLERLFHQRWWSYEDRPFNLSGYICLEFSLLWGVACVFAMKVVHPLTVDLVALMPRKVGLILLVLLLLVLAVDIAATVAAMVGLSRRLAQLEELAGRIHAASNELGEELSDRMLSSADRLSELRADLELKTADLREDLAERASDLRDDLSELKSKREKLLSIHRFGHRRLLKAFPSMTSAQYEEALEELRRRAAAYSRRKKEEK